MSTKRILIVDDEESQTRLLKLNLEASGEYEVRSENDPLLAVAAAREFLPDLILLDVMMPGADGGEVCAHLQSQGRLKNTPIVFLTAAVKKDEVGSRGGLIGGFPYLAKPVDLDEILACFKKLLG